MLSKNLKSVNNLTGLDEIVTHLHAKIGALGGRKFYQDNDPDLLTMTDIVKKFYELVKPPEKSKVAPIVDTKELAKIFGDVKHLNEEGDKELKMQNIFFRAMRSMTSFFQHLFYNWEAKLAEIEKMIPPQEEVNAEPIVTTNVKKEGQGGGASQGMAPKAQPAKRNEKFEAARERREARGAINQPSAADNESAETPPPLVLKAPTPVAIVTPALTPAIRPTTPPPLVVAPKPVPALFKVAPTTVFDKQKMMVEQLTELLRQKEIGVKPKVFEDHELDEFLAHVEKIKKEIDAGHPIEHAETSVEKILEEAGLTGDKLIEKRERLRLIINQAFVARELRQKGKHVVPRSNELQLLSAFGYSIDDIGGYENKDDIYRTFQEIVSKQFTERSYKRTIDEVRAAVKSASLEARLKSMGIEDPLKVKKFTSALHVVDDFYKELEEQAAEIQLEKPLNFPDNAPLAFKAVEQLFEHRKKKLINKTIIEMVAPLKPEFESATAADLVFPKSLDIATFVDACKAIRENAAIQDEFKFFGKWGEYIKAELIQGFENESEALIDGICWGVCSNLQMLAQSKNLSESEMIDEINLNSKARFMQARYGLKLLLKEKDKGVQEESHAIPLETLMQNKFTEDKELLSIYPYDNQGNDLEEASQQCQMDLNASKGWMRLSLVMPEAGHATLMRLDSRAKMAWFFDPNIGFLCFEQPTDYDFEKSRDRCLNFFHELVDHLYPDTVMVYSRVIK